MNKEELVYIDEYGLLGTNFYWHKYQAKGLSKADILSAGLLNDRLQVHKDLIAPLLLIEEELNKLGYKLYLKEGYRSESLYNIIYKRRVEKFGQTATDRLLNMKDMPHAKGASVDVALWSIKDDKEVYMRRGEDGDDALFVDYYKDKSDEESRIFYNLQSLVIELMQKHGFRLGTKREYFHFDYRSTEPINYFS